MQLKLSLHHDSIRSFTLEKSKIIFQKNRRDNHYACVHAKLLQSCPSLYDPMNCSPPGSSVHGILQARVMECFGMLSSSGSSQSRCQTLVSCISGKFFTISTTWEGLIIIIFPLIQVPFKILTE